MGRLAGIVETVGFTSATAPRKFEGGSEGGAGPGACGRLGCIGKLRCGVSFDFIICQISSISFHLVSLAAHHAAGFLVQ